MQMTSGKEPRWTYAKPTEKSMPGKPGYPGFEGSKLSTHISEYKLPEIDVDKDRRNFPGYMKENFYTLAEMQQGDTSGTTETDRDTDPKGSGGYTKINQKRGASQRVRTKSSSKGTA